MRADGSYIPPLFARLPPQYRARIATACWAHYIYAYIAAAPTQSIYIRTLYIHRYSTPALDAEKKARGTLDSLSPMPTTTTTPNTPHAAENFNPTTEAHSYICWDFYVYKCSRSGSHRCVLCIRREREKKGIQRCHTIIYTCTKFLV